MSRTTINIVLVEYVSFLFPSPITCFLSLLTESPSCSFERDTCHWSADAAWTVGKNLESAAGGGLESTAFSQGAKELLTLHGALQTIFDRYAAFCYDRGRVWLCSSQKAQSIIIPRPRSNVSLQRCLTRVDICIAPRSKSWVHGNNHESEIPYSFFQILPVSFFSLLISPCTFWTCEWKEERKLILSPRELAVLHILLAYLNHRQTSRLWDSYILQIVQVQVEIIWPRKGRFRRHNLTCACRMQLAQVMTCVRLAQGFEKCFKNLQPHSSCMRQSWGSCEVDLHEAIRVVWMTWASCMRQS